jgi:exonuclease III
MGSFKLTTWNCRGAFRRKHAHALELAPDILIVSECESLTDLSQTLGAKTITGAFRVGEDGNNGLGVLSYGDFHIEVDAAYDSSIQWIVPLNVHGPVAFSMLAVWTKPDPMTGRYIHRLVSATERYADILRRERVVIAGDFNQNVRLDVAAAPRFSALMKAWDEYALASTYHEHRSCAHGEEPDPTFFQYFHRDKPQHLDYVFATASLRRGLFRVAVGDPDTWLSLSDHMPVSAEFKLD